MDQSITGTTTMALSHTTDWASLGCFPPQGREEDERWKTKILYVIHTNAGWGRLWEGKAKINFILKI